MMRIRSDDTKAFTMVEMLITVSIFSILIAVLVSGVYAGTRGWIRGDQLLRRSIATRTALDLLRRDIEGARIVGEAETPALLFETGEGDRSVIQCQVVVASSLAYDSGSCRIVTWEVVAEGDESRWIRSTVPCRASDEQADIEVETILKDVDSVGLSFRYGNEWSDEVRPNANPDQVTIKVSLRGTPRIRTLGSALIRAERRDEK